MTGFKLNNNPSPLPGPDANDDQLPPLEEGLAMLGFFQPSLARNGLIRTQLTNLHWRRIAYTYSRGPETGFAIWQEDMRLVERVENGARVRVYSELHLTMDQFLADLQVFQNANLDFMAGLEEEHIEEEASHHLAFLPVEAYMYNVSPPALAPQVDLETLTPQLPRYSA